MHSPHVTHLETPTFTLVDSVTMSQIGRIHLCQERHYGWSNNYNTTYLVTANVSTVEMHSKVETVVVGDRWVTRLSVSSGHSVLGKLQMARGEGFS
eukprot:894446-Amphidinium_carterae.2